MATGRLEAAYRDEHESRSRDLLCDHELGL